MSSTSTSEESILLVGGCGYVGIHLTKKLKSCGFKVIVIDISPCPAEIQPLVEYHQCGATNTEAIVSIISQSSPVALIHLASTGMSGSAMLNPNCRIINIGAVDAAIEGCVKGNVPILIYTSTYNVVYGGKEIIEGDESAPYFPIDGHNDHYAPSKTIAEEHVLAANGLKLADGRVLKTCAIRPAAIYGEGEQRHFPRLLKHFDSGIFLFRIGRAIVDWVHVDNLAESFLCAFKSLSCLPDDKVSTAPAGKPYFISDGTPIDNFEFFRPLCIARDCEFPTITIPTEVMLWLGWLLENTYWVAAFCGLPFEPFLTRSEVLKVGRSHYFRIENAKASLGYRPAFGSIEGGRRIADYYRIKSLADNASFFRIASWYWWVPCIGGLILTGVIAFESVDIANGLVSATSLSGRIGMVALQLADWLALFLFRSRFGVKVVFWLALAAHITEGCMAYFTAKKLKCVNTVWLWAIQTLLLGYPSLSMLHKRQSLMAALDIKEE